MTSVANDPGVLGSTLPTSGADDATVLREQATVLARAEEVHRGLVQVVLGGGGLPEVATALAGALDLAVLVTSPDGRVLAEAGDDADLALARSGPWMAPDGRFRVESDLGAVGAHDASTPTGAAGHAVVQVAAGGVDHGRVLAVSAQRVLGTDDVHALERAAMVCALVVVKQLAVAAVEERYQADFLRDLLLGRVQDASAATEHASSLGWDLDRPLVVVVADPDGGLPRTGAGGPGADTEPPRAGGLGLRPVVDRLATAWQTVVRSRDRGSVVCAFTTEVVAVLGLPLDGDPDRMVRDVVAAVRGDGGGGRRPFTTGVSRVVSGVEGLAAAYEQARTCVRVARQVHGSGGIAHFDRLGVHRLLSLVPDSTELRSFLDETLRELGGEGAEAQDLRRTLEVLLDTNLNVAETARRLHFHYNTLRYRIAKLERILGPFTEDANLRLDLALALRIVQMRGLS